MTQTHENVQGTPAGYRWHWRNGTSACPACLAAHNLDQRRYRDRQNPAAARVRLPLLDLVRLLDLLPPDRVGAALELLGAATADRVETVRAIPQEPVRRGIGC